MRNQQIIDAMRPRVSEKVVEFVGILVGGIVSLSLETLITKLLWNAILIPLFHMPYLGYWYAMGLVMLCNTLFNKVHNNPAK